MMFQKMPVGYAERQNLQAVELNYEGGRLSMVVVLPSVDTGLGRLEETLSAQALEALDSELRVREVNVSLPRFKISTDGSLVPLMHSLGVRHTFDRETADFSGINGRRPPDDEALFVSDILQKALVDVNEEGTEAVAATAVMMVRCAASLRPPRKSFRCSAPITRSCSLSVTARVGRSCSWAESLARSSRR
jgi:serpin B